MNNRDDEIQAYKRRTDEAELKLRTTKALLDEAQCELNRLRSGAANAEAGSEAIADAQSIAVLTARNEQLKKTILDQASVLSAAGVRRARWRRLLPPFLRRSSAKALAERQWEVDAIASSQLFEPMWYLTANPDAAGSGIDPLEHYLTVGDARGRDPHPLFKTKWYRIQYPEARAARMSALAHYVTIGVSRGLKPSALFDTTYYLRQNPDVAASQVNPLFHYMTIGAYNGRDPHPLFSSSFYLEQYPDVSQVRDNPLVHYLAHGWREGRRPHQDFDLLWYLESNPDASASGLCPLLHYELYGKPRGAMHQRPLDAHPEAIRASRMEFKPQRTRYDTASD